MKKKRSLLLCLCLMIFISGCGKVQSVSAPEADREIGGGLLYDYRMETDYADQFAVDYYQGGYALISISDGSRFLVVPKNSQAPEDLEKDIVILEQPVDNIYLVATAVMDMLCSIDALDRIRLSGTKAQDWYIPEARAAMEAGDILYAGKYSAPDYEQILAQKTELAIQSTMILHAPEIRENLEEFGIPVLVDYSSYEDHPLGRCEWVKLYGVLTGQEGQAMEAFREQKEALMEVTKEEPLGKSAVFFYITSRGMVSVKKSSDYAARMIELAGGTYLFDDLGAEDEKGTSSVNMQMEEFYARAADADYLIYNSAVEGELTSLEELTARYPLLKELKAVQNQNVWCTTGSMYQSSMDAGIMIRDIHRILTNEEQGNEAISYFFKLE